MYFKNRYDAAMQLIPLLKKYKNEEGIILAVPRGGVPIAYYIAKEYGFPLDLLMTKKLGHPFSPEYAIGSVSMESSFVENKHDIPEDYIKEETQRILQQLKERYKRFMGNKEPLSLRNKTVLIIDDGIATGLTILGMIKILRQQHPKKIIVAVPVAPRESAIRIKELVDDFICVHIPKTFYGVGMFYNDFSEVSDDDVISYLNELNERKVSAY
jgi:predicted phosphoribosyltransferase